MSVIVSIVHFGINFNTFVFIGGGSAFLQPLVKLLRQVAKFAGGAIEENVGNPDGRRGGLLLKVVEVVVTTVVSNRKESL